ncbi:cysteine synthase family protein [Labrys sp. La1]|uniref:cysteine synthase family protein n=1 Tax=Labrys sp. La1 TaxID=3404917 RepID=UPI003EB7D078
MKEEKDYLREFETPRFARLASNLHAASFSLMKLLPARFMIDRAEADGRLAPGGHVVETTSGTFGLAMAMVCAIRRYRLTLITSSTLTDDRFTRRLEGLGATQIVVDDPIGDGNQRGRLEKLTELISASDGIFWPKQYDSPHNPLAYGRFAELALRSFGRIDCLIGCVGTGGSLCGTGSVLRPLFPDLRIVAVDTHHSVLFGHPAGRRTLRGLGNSVLPRNVRHTMIDEVHWVGALPAYTMAHALVREHGLFVGPSSAAAALVASWFAKRNPHANTLVIMPDEGHRYLDTTYNDRWLEALSGWPCKLPIEPTLLNRPTPADEAAWTRFAWKQRTLEMVLKQQKAPSTP